MTDNTEREWPTFGDILDELKTLGHLSAVSAAPAAPSMAASVATVAPTETIAEPSLDDAPAFTEIPGVEPIVETPMAAAPIVEPTGDDIVVPVLPPSSLDTTLLSQPAAAMTDAIDTSALEPLAPAPDVDALTAPAETPVFEATEEAPAFEPMSIEPVEPEPFEPLTFESTDVAETVVEETAEVGIVEEAGSVFDSPVFEPIDAPTFEAVDFTAEPFTPDTFESEPFAATEAQVDELPAPFEPLQFDSPAEPEAPMVRIAEGESAETFTFDPAAAGFAVIEPEVESTDWASTEDPAAAPTEPEAPGTVFTFDPASVEETPEEFTATQWSSSEDDEAADFDSIATANAIESDLQDLFAMDQSVAEQNFEVPAVEETEDVAEVVPLHPIDDGPANAVVGLDAGFDPTAQVPEEPLQSWVGIEEEEEAREDPWAYMRPDEGDEIKGGFWSNRPKFFGGNERKAKKAARQQAAAAAEMRSNMPGPNCPNCNEVGQVDLDDPVGGKIHASCQHCGHVWSQASDANLHSESA